MIKTYKDAIIAIFCVIWLIGSFYALHTFGDYGTMLFQQIALLMFAIMVLFKINNKKFNTWLNKKI